MPARKPTTAKRGRPSKADKANENLAKLAIEQAECSCEEHPNNHANCDNECDCWNGESEPQVSGTMPFTIPLSKVMEQQAGGEEEKGKRIAITLRQKYNDSKAKGWIREDGLIQMDIFRLPLFSTDGAIGAVADKEFIFRTYVSIEYGENEDYFMLLQRYGPGAYKIYFRNIKGIMATYEKHIGKSTPPAPAVVDPVTGQPTINVTMPNQPSQGDGISNLLKQAEQFGKLRDALVPPWVSKMMEQAPRAQAENPVQQAPMSKETAFLEVLASDPEIVNAAREKVRGWAFGDEGGGRKQSLTEMVVMEGMKQFGPVLAQLAQAGAEYLATKARGGNSGPAQMGQTQMAQSGQAQIAGTTADGMAQATQDSSGQTAGTPNSGGNASPVSPLLSNLLSALKANQAPKEVAALIRGVMETDRSVIPLIEGLLDLRPHQILIQLATFGGPQAVAIVAMPHSEIWVEDLITEMNIETEPEEKEDGSETDA